MPVAYIYRQYAREGSLVRRFHLRFLSSALAARALFGMRVRRADVRTFTQFFDLTSVLLKSVVDRELAQRPTARLLEIGVGAYAILSGSIARKWRRHVDGIDVEQSLIDSARKHVAQNHVDVTIVKSDVLTEARGKYGVIFWNMPYYQDPKTYLPRLFEQLPEHLERGGALFIGYNTNPLKRSAVEAILADYPRLALEEAVTWRWNRHEVLRIGLVERRAASSVTLESERRIGVE
jgi:hypothetical protein